MPYSFIIPKRIAWLDQQLEFNPSGIRHPLNPNDMPAAIYSLSGIRRSRLEPGLNIIRQNDGTASKIFVKP